MPISQRFLKSLLTSVGWWLGIGVSFVFYLVATKNLEEKAQAEFDYQTGSAQLAIQTNVRSYIDVLRGVSALFYTTDSITREQFHTYVKKLNLKQSFPGIASLNFAQHVLANDKNAFEATVRKDTSINGHGYPNFSVNPAGNRTEYHVITYLEPIESNPESLGLDIAAHKAVANALTVSRDTGQLSSSGRLIQISGTPGHVGLAMRMPLYRRGMPTDTSVQKRAAYYGSVGAGFDLNKLMLGAVDKSAARNMRIRIYDAGTISNKGEKRTVHSNHLLFDSATILSNKNPVTAPITSSALMVKRVRMTVGPRIWEIEFSVNKTTMLKGLDAHVPSIVLTTGLLASVLLYSIYYSLVRAQRHAVELANEMTKDLRASEANLAEAQRMAHLGSWILEPASGKMTWSEETYRIFGTDHVDAPQCEDFLERIHEDDRERIQKGLAGLIGSGEEFRAEHRIMQDDGSIRWVETIARPDANDPKALLRGSIMDVTERKHTLEALKRSRELLRELTAYQNRVKEEERKRIAREIHDELGQTLLVLRIDVSMLDARTAKSHPRLNEKVRNALQHLDATVKTIRTIINNLRPSVLDFGLIPAIEWQVKEFRRRNSIQCELMIRSEELTVDDARATTLFRILQESLTNVIKHARAERVVIELHEHGNQLVMKISDDGVGIDLNRQKPENRFGLVGMKERILALNGKFVIDSAPGKGTTLTIFIPLETAAPEPHETT